MRGLSAINCAVKIPQNYSEVSPLRQEKVHHNWSKHPLIESLLYEKYSES